MATDAVLPATPRRPRVRDLRRVPLIAVITLLIAVWVVISFGRTLAGLNEATERAAALRAEAGALEIQLQQSRAEMELAQTPAFQRMLARSYGMGMAGEQAFALAAGAPAPPPVMMLGGDPAARNGAPLDVWLGLLFGD